MDRSLLSINLLFLLLFSTLFIRVKTEDIDPWFGSDFSEKCPLGFFYCDEHNDGQCLHQKQYCDGEFDCEDRSDEPPGCQKAACNEGEFRCKLTRKCLPAGYRCDRENDCGTTIGGLVDDSDEQNCGDDVKCPPGMHKCLGTTHCIKLSAFCDGKRDCPDKSDEHDKCGKPGEPTSKPCKYSSVQTLDAGLLCSCPEGLVAAAANGSTDCVDDDECTRPFYGESPVCAQQCVNKVAKTTSDPRFECLCNPGFKYLDNLHCQPLNVPEDEDASVFLIGFEHLSHKKLSEFVHGPPLDEKNGLIVQAIAFDHRKRKICWITNKYSTLDSRVTVECVFLKKESNSSFDGGVASKWVVPGLPIKGVSQMAFDWIGDTWWFLDNLSNRLFVCKGDEMKPCVVLDLQGIKKPDTFAIDPVSGFIFVSELSTGIWRASLDGKDTVLMTNGTVIHPKGIYADLESKNVYWVDNYLEHVEAVDYLNANRRRHVASGNVLKSVKSIQIFGDKIYAASTLEKVAVIDKYGVNQLDFPVRDDSSEFFKLEKILIFHRQMQPDADHPCKTNNGNCDHICFPLYTADHTPTAVCKCAEGFLSKNEGRQCSDDFDVKKPVLLFGRTTLGEISGISLDSLLLNATSGNPLRLPLPVTGMHPVIGLRRSTAIAVDSRSKVMYYCDPKNSTIYRRGLFGGDPQAVLTEGIGNCEGMALDAFSGNLYYTDQAHRLIVVVNVERPQFRTPLIYSNLSNPRGIAVHPEKNYLFWTDWTDSANPDQSKSKIERSSFSGGQRTILVSTHIHWPNVLSVDSRDNWLYWCDAYYMTIERVRFTGAQRQQIIRADQLVSPYGITVFQNLIFWTEFTSGKINFARIDSTGQLTSAPETIYEDKVPLFALALYDETPTPADKVSDVCSPQKNFGGCQQLCFPNFCGEKKDCQSLTCQCAEHYSIGDDGSSCKVDKNASISRTCSQITEFQCVKSKICIDRSLTCDAADDCDDNSDEDRGPGGICEHYKCPEEESFLCNSNQCIDKTWLCDGENDCSDGSDEALPQCKEEKKCPQNKFLCKYSKKCIHQKWVCDGVKDCSTKNVHDLSDEETCEVKPDCGPGLFKCRNSQCISLTYVCDGHSDCRDGSDELHCDSGCAIGSEFQCSEGAPCMSNKFRCDGVFDCLNQEDEHGCLQKISNSTVSPVYCPLMNQFQCSKQFECVPLAFKCDGDVDCQDGSDEEGCPAHTCPGDHFKCTYASKCLQQKFVCDGYNDCHDASDEKSCGKKVNLNPERCLPPFYLCRNDSRMTCLPPQKVCDKEYDCPLKDDEDFLCAENLCRESTCEQVCHNRPSGYVCDCKPGFTLQEDRASCKKEDPCHFGACSQLCEPHGSARYCHCFPGYSMTSDKFTCKSTSLDKPFLIYTNRYDIRSVSLENDALVDLSSSLALKTGGQSSVSLLSQLRNTIAVDFFYENASNVLVFWSDIQKDNIYRGRISSGILVDIMPIVKVGIWTAEGLAVDWIGRHVYWVDSLLDQIQVVDFDGVYAATVLSGEMHNLRSLAVDPLFGLMFWTDWQESNPRIERATMAGTDRRVLFKVNDLVGGGWPNGLTLDYSNQRVYWVDAKSDSVHTITYSGEDYRLVLRDSQNMAHPFSVSIFEGHMYWSDWRNTNIYRADKFNGSNVELIEDTTNQPFDLKVVHPSRQPRPAGMKNPCRDNGGCSHLCLIESKTSRKCACPHMMVLDKFEDTVCRVINQTLIFATSTTVTAIEIDRPNAIVFPLLAPRGDEHISSLAADPRSMTVFWSDVSNGRIHKMVLRNATTEQQVLLKSGADNCHGLSVDSKQGLLYFTGYSTFENLTEGSISVLSIDGRYKKTILESRTEPLVKKPVQVNYVEGELYWFDLGYTPPALFRASASGKKMREISLKNVDPEATVGPASLIVDSNKRLFWTQPGSNKTRILELQSMKLHTLNTSSDPLVTVPTLIALDDDAQELIFYDKISGDIMARMISTAYSIGGKPFELRKSSRLLRANNTNLVAMAMLDRSTIELEDLEEDKAPCEDMGCDQLCIRSFKDFKCICADGYEFFEGKCEIPPKRLLYISTDNRIFWSAEDNSEKALESTEIPFSGNDLLQLQPRRLGVDARRQKIYLLDSKLNEVYGIDVKNPEKSFSKILSGGASRLSGIAVDPVTGYIFVSSFVPMGPGRHLQGSIEVIHPEFEEMRVTVFRRYNDTISNLVLDPEAGWLFWLSRTGVMKCRFDGSFSAEILTDNPLISQITVDTKKKLLFFTSKMSTILESVDYSGNKQTLLGTSKYDTVEVMDGVLYYSIKRELFRAEIDSNDGHVMNETLKNLGTLSAQLKELKSFDRKLAGKIQNPCSENNGGCEQMCYYLGPSFPHKCGCVFSKPNKDKKTCDSHRSFLAYVRGDQISFAPTYTSLDVSESHLSTSTVHERRQFETAYKPITNSDIIRGPVAVAADNDRYRLIFSDIKANRIISIKIDQSDHFVVVENVKHVEGVALDPKHRDLYFTSGPRIMRVNMNSDDRLQYPKTAETILELSEYDKPRGIAVDPCQMLIYYTNWRVDMPSINRVYFSGYKHERIISTDIRTPNAIVLDYTAQKLYWSDARLDKIERADYDGQNREIVVENSNRSISVDYPAHPFSLALHNDHLYYTDWIHHAVIMLDKFTGQGATVIHGNMSDQPMGVTVFAEDLPKCGNDQCSTTLGLLLKCEDLCRMDSKGQARCACKPGRLLNPDGITCSGESLLTECTNDEFLCVNSGRCIDYELVCDGVAECPNNEDENLDYCTQRQCRKNYFDCGNAMCIRESKRCNQVNDCINYDDERNCNCTRNEFRCSDGQCVAESLRCNHEKDCIDASDEIGCQKRDCAQQKYHNKTMINCFDTTQCILPEWICDGANDCWTGSDEANCPSEFTKLSIIQKTRRIDCQDDEHKCSGTETCISKTFVCDGEKDCTSGSDEENCPKRKCDTLYNAEFECANGECIDMFNKCDGEKHCNDGSDELNCTEKCDSVKSFLCGTGVCIPLSFRCDGINDCLDASDEANCTRINPSVSLQCKLSEFQCSAKDGHTAVGECISLRNVCDGEHDCPNGDDEKIGCVHRTCNSGEFRCNSGQCVNLNWTCNEIPDCLDESDESDALCGVHYRAHCSAGQFACDNGVCIDEGLLCDQKNDCGDYSDEKKCALDECVKNSPCEDRCTQKKVGFQCSCTEEGKVLNPVDNRTCVYKNRCEELPCSQICETRGRPAKYRYSCSCVDGYVLDENLQRTCRYKPGTGEPLLAVINSRQLRMYTLDGHPRNVILANLTNGVALDYDYSTQKIYFTDVSIVGSSIGYSTLSTKKFTDLEEIQSSSPEGIFIDFVGRNIYWCDRDSHSISMALLDGKYSKMLLKGEPLSEPRSIVGDPELGLVFWTDWGKQAHIGRMTYSGKEVRTIVDSSLKWPNALAVDIPMKRIYWGDAYLNYIGSSDYNGDNRRLVLRKSVGRIFGLAIFEDFMYWSESTNKTVQKANKRTGKKQVKVIENQLYKPMGIKVFHSLLQPQPSELHPCSTPDRCDNLCVPTVRPSKYECVCADGFKAAGSKCVPDCNPSEFVCEKTFKCLKFYYKCDGFNDCGDYSDEPDDCPPFKCSPGFMMCDPTVKVHNDSNCVESEFICDGHRDCFNGRDEEETLCQDYNCADEQFKCTSTKKCVPIEHVCDGLDHCGDGSDERNCALNLQKCTEPDYFLCRDFNTSAPLKCIPRTFLFDGERDCPQGEDELQYSEGLSCPFGDFECGVGSNRRCIQKSHLCNGQSDCVNNEDESDKMCANRTCTNYEFRCSTGRCVPLSFLCDGTNDCPGGEDEKDCASTLGKCRDDQFMCHSDKKCISKQFVCDGGPADCLDGSDELDCRASEGGEVLNCGARIPCMDMSKCYDASQKCDGTAQCDDYSDEMFCDRCDNSTFQCRVPSSKCIQLSKVCDGISDCLDHSDEIYCNCDEEDDYFNKGGLRCFQNTTADISPIHKYQCVPQVKICDGLPDCPNGLDESEAVCKRHECPPSFLKCSNNKCYPISGLCDGVNDCADESDEKNVYCTTKCGADSFRCRTGVCIPRKLQCNNVDDCGDNSDEDSCNKHLCDAFGVCTHFCLQQGHIPKCYCAPGYVHESSVKCKAEDRLSAVAVLVDGNLVRTFKSKPGAPSSVDVSTVKINEGINAFDFWSPDGKESVVYFLRNGILENGTLEDMISNRRTTRHIYHFLPSVKTTHEAVETELAFDWVHRNVYTVLHNAPLKRSTILVRKNINPENVVTVIEHDLGTVSSIAVSTREGKIYWTCLEPFPAIESANLDGSARKTVVLTDVFEPKSLIVDEFNGRLFWVDTMKGTIESSKMDGKDRRVIKKYGYKNGTLQDRPSSIDIFDDYLYIIGQPSGVVWRTHKFGHYIDTFVKKVKALDPLAVMKVVHPTKRFADHPNVCITDNICGRQPCVTINDTPKCLCNEGEYFDGGKCVKLRWLFAADRPCGKHVCKNGGYCNQLNNSCICPPGSFGNSCENSICKNACMNNGTCQILTSGRNQKPKAYCSCPVEYSGNRCERYKCTGMCGPTGSCKIDENSGLTFCHCDEGYHGDKCDVHLSTESTTCENYCYNNGECSTAFESKPFCKCGGPFTGRRCENCMSKETGLEVVCLNGGYCKSDARMCVCQLGFVGANCGTDLCKNYCINGGECIRNGTLATSPIMCLCPPGFSGRRCEEDACSRNDTVCQNDGVCVVKPDGKAVCACTNRFKGQFCEENRPCDEYCQNGGECREKLKLVTDPRRSHAAAHWTCECKPGYTGDKCENLDACDGECENGGFCRLDPNTGPACHCPAGVGSPRCNHINASSCQELKCQNFGQCLGPSTAPPRCVCRLGWKGLTCNLPTCNNYCQNTGKCFTQDNMPICACPQNTAGSRCEVMVPKMSRENVSPVGTMMSMFISVLIMCVLILIAMYFVFIKNDRYGIKLFRHQRMFNEPVDGDMDEFHNPAFMVDEDDPHVNETTNFTNPTYSSLNNGVYNDTVERSDDVDTTPAVIATSSTIQIPTSEKKKLLTDPLSDNQ